MKIRLFFTATTLLFFSVINTSIAQSYDDLEDDVEEFIEESRKIYQLDQEGLESIWEAYCGQLDPFENESSQYASEIGRQMLEREKGKVDDLIYKSQAIMGPLDQMEDDPEHGSDAKKLYEQMYNEVEKLNRLKQGAVLQGADHPFIRMAIEYGKERHKDMCDDYGSYRICDKEFDGVYGRPDLVYIDNSAGLYILEFKPDNSKAKDKGWDQVEGYMPGVVAFFQRCFPNGRNGEIVTKSPADDSFLKALKDCNAAWDSDGKNIICHIDVKTYNRCEKRFN